MQVTWVWFWGREDPLEKEMKSCLGSPMDRGACWATVHGWQTAGHDWATNTFTFTFWSLKNDLHSKSYMCPCFRSADVYSVASVMSNSLQPLDCCPPGFLEFLRQEYWRGSSFPSPGDLPDPGIEPMSPASRTLAAEFYATSTTWE